MMYGNNPEEVIQIIIANYENALESYKKSNSILDRGIDPADNEQLRVLIKNLTICHGSLFTAFEVAFRQLLNNNTTGVGNKSFPNLYDFAKELDKLAEHPPTGAIYNYKVLDLVDFNCIVTTKDIRNDLAHNGIIREFRHYRRLFYNLRKVIHILKPATKLSDIPPKYIPGLTEREQFDRFFNSLFQFDREYCAYILVCEPMWDVPDEQVKRLLSLPWTIVIDLDGRRIHDDFSVNRSRIESLLLEIGRSVISFNTKQIDTSLFTIRRSEKCIPYLNFSDGEICCKSRLEPTLQTLRIRRQSRLSSIEDINKKTQKENALLAVLNTYLGKDIRDFVIASLSEYGDGETNIHSLIDRIFPFCQSDGIFRIVGVQDSDDSNSQLSKDWAGIANPLDCETEDFLRIAAHDYWDKLESLTTYQPPHEEGLRFPLRNVGATVVPTSHVFDNASKYFEILHLDVGTEPSDDDSQNFYRGEIATWSALRQGCAADLAQSDREKLEQKIRGSFNLQQGGTHCYYIYHDPGCGGTTLGRQIAWNLHKDYPVLILLHYDANLGNRIKDLYDELRQTPFLILIDTAYGDVREDQYGQIEKCLSVRPVVGLFVQRQERTINNKNNRLLLSTVHQEQLSIVKDKCREYVKQLGCPLDELKQREAALSENIQPNHMVPFIINMYLMDSSFKSPGVYVQSFLKQIGDASGSMAIENINRALKFIAFTSYYANERLSGLFTQRVCAENISENANNLRTILQSYEKLLLYFDKDGRPYRAGREGIAKIQTRHWLLAFELLHHLIGKDKWEREIKTTSLEFIEYAVKMGLTDEMTEIISKLFARRDEREDSEKRLNNLSRLLTTVCENGMDQDGAELLNQVGERLQMYVKEHPELKNEHGSKDRHIFALLARIWAQCARFYRSVQFNESLMDHYTELSLEILEPKESLLSAYDDRDFYDLYHMAGACAKKKMEHYLVEIEEMSQLSSERLLQIQRAYHEAIDYFERTTNLGNQDYGLPSQLETYCILIKNIFRLFGITNEVYRLDKLDCDEYEWILQAMEDGIALCGSSEDYMLDDKSIDIFLKNKNRFLQCCKFDTASSCILEEMDGRITRLRTRQDSYTEHGIYNARVMMVETILSKYGYNYYRLQQSKKDFQNIWQYIGEALKYNPGRTHYLYRLWFKLAKIRDEQYSLGKQYAQDWLALRLRKGQYAVLPHYYLYVLSALANQDVKLVDDLRASLTEACKKAHLNDREKEQIRDYYTSNANAMGHLVDYDFIASQRVQEFQNVSTVEGVIAEIAENEASGWIKLTEPCIQKLYYPNERHLSQVFFNPRSPKFSKTQEKELVHLKLMFSFARMAAIDKTVVPVKRKAPVAVPSTH